MAPFEKLRVEPGKKYFLNVGSVGQPRDGIWLASYAIFDSDRGFVELHRLEYDIQKAQQKILDAGLPLRLAERLAVGK
jgi:diadenosine tetraphosphatase ApaH/serine/threonine PP2A family protein phosphatase